MRNLEEKTAIVTGAAGGLGVALAEALASEGMNLALVDWHEGRLEDLARAMKGAPGRVTIHRLDLRDQDALSAFADEFRQTHGALNLLANVAGITLQKSFALHSLEDWDEVLAINLGGPVAMIRTFLPDLEAADEAHILNVSSMAGFLGLPTQSSYCTSKAALTVLGESLRVELGAHGIGVTTALPGTVRTELIARTLARSENVEIAEKIIDQMQWVGMRPERAAAKMVRAIKKNKGRLRVGIDAYLTDWVVRLHPPLLLGPLAFVYDRVLARS